MRYAQPPRLFLLLVLLQLEYGRRAAQFMGDDNEGLTIRAVFLADEDETLRAEIASRIGGHCFGEIPVIEIIGELGCGWIADIVHHGAIARGDTA